MTYKSLPPTHKLFYFSISGYVILYTLFCWRKNRSTFQWFLFVGVHGWHRVHEDGTSETTQPNDHVQQERCDMSKGRAAVFYVPRWWHEGKVASDRHHDPDQTYTITSNTGRRDVIASCYVFESEQIEINCLRINIVTKKKSNIELFCFGDASNISV